MGYHLGIVCVWAGVREADRNQMCAKGIGSGSVRFDGSSGFGKLIEPVCARALGGKGVRRRALSLLLLRVVIGNWRHGYNLLVRLDLIQLKLIQFNWIPFGLDGASIGVRSRVGLANGALPEPKLQPTSLPRLCLVG